MAKKVIKFSVGINSEEAPEFMEGEGVGIFYTIEYEIDESDMTGPLFAKWCIEKEAEVLRDAVRVKIDAADKPEDADIPQ